MSGYNHLTPYEEQAAAAAAAEAFEAEAYAQQIAATGAYGLGASAYAGIPGASAALLGAGMYHGAAGAFGSSLLGGAAGLGGGAFGQAAALSAAAANRYGAASAAAGYNYYDQGSAAAALAEYQLHGRLDAAAADLGNGYYRPESTTVDLMKQADEHLMAQFVASTRGVGRPNNQSLIQAEMGQDKTVISGKPAQTMKGKVKSRKKQTGNSSYTPESTTLVIGGHKLVLEQEIFPVALPPPKWYASSAPLGLPDDNYWLSELQCYLRSCFAEVFGATEREMANQAYHGRNKPQGLGQVGIRCMYCKNQPFNAKAPQAVSYPSQITGIYNSVQQMFRLHMEACPFIPLEVKAKMDSLKDSSSSRGGRKQYWVDSAKRLGLVDTDYGIHFGRDPSIPPPPMEDSYMQLEEETGGAVEKGFPMKSGKYISPDLTWSELVMKQRLENNFPLVLPEDESLISDYLYLTLEQMEPCTMMDADRVGCYKGRPIGFPGLACKHCIGQAGCGRYFPASEASLSQTTTSQTIVNHVRNCRRVPVEIRENLELMKRAKLGPNARKGEKPKHGGRKIFFHRLWCRIQGIEMDNKDDVSVKIGRQRGAKNKRPARGRKRRGRKEAMSDDDSDQSDKEDPMASEKDEYRGASSSDDDDGADVEEPVAKSKNVLARATARSSADSEDETESEEEEVDTGESWFEGSVRPATPDDAHWLSESQCFIRANMIEFFCNEHGKGTGTMESPIEAGQVGIRCAYCAPVASEGHNMEYPSSVRNIYYAAMDFHKRHFLTGTCPNMPGRQRKTYRALKEFGDNAETEIQKYWADSAREVGLANWPGAEGAGIRFYRDPLARTPADEIAVKYFAAGSKQSLVLPEDKGMASDYTNLLLQQVKPTRFKSIDRRGGPGSRGRDRAIGFAGLACIHCEKKKSSGGRYFPLTSRHLADNTVKSMMSHLSNCSRCPEMVKASLAYLQHRHAIQRQDIGSSAKNIFWKRVWERYHCAGSDLGNKNDKKTERNSPSSKASSVIGNRHERKGVSSKSDDDSDAKASDYDSDYIQREMGDLIKEAAKWLTEQDAIRPSTGLSSRGGRAGRGRGLPTKRGMTVRDVGGGRGNGGISPKRQRARLEG